MASFSGIAGTLLAPAWKLLIEPQREAKKEQQRALDEQKRAQSIAEADAASARRRTAMDQAKANQKAPDVGTLLSNAQSPTAGGTLLTGASGIDPRRLKLGQTSLLGA